MNDQETDNPSKPDELLAAVGLERLVRGLLRFTKQMVVGSFGFWLCACSEIAALICDAVKCPNAEHFFWRLSRKGDEIMESQLPQRRRSDMSGIGCEQHKNQPQRGCVDCGEAAYRSLAVRTGSASGLVTPELLRISREVREENGEAERRLCAKCNWEQRSRTAIINEYGDPRVWETLDDEKCSVCDGMEPCSHNFDALSWPNISDEVTPEVASSKHAKR